MDPFASNLKALRKRRGATQEGVAAELGIGRGRYAKYEEGRAHPDFEVLRGIARFFDVSIDGLLNRDLSQGEELEERRLFPITVDEQGEGTIEVIPGEATAGYLTGYGDPEYIEQLQRMKLPFLPSGKHRAFPIKGDSMWPVRDGSYVVGRYIESLEQLRDGRTYVVVSRDEGITYKRVWKKLEEDGTLLLVPDNKSYEPFRVDASTVVELWEHVCTINTQEYGEEELSYDSIFQMLRSLNIQLTDLRSFMEEMRGRE